jgi:hypothetical protein
MEAEEDCPLSILESEVPPGGKNLFGPSVTIVVWTAILRGFPLF